MWIKADSVVEMTSTCISIRVLVARPLDFVAYDADACWREIRAELGPLLSAGYLECERLVPASEASLRSIKGRTDVVHLLAYPRGQQHRGLQTIVLENQQGYGRAITAQYLGKVLATEFPNACVVVQPPPGFDGVHDGLPQELVLNGAAMAAAARAGMSGALRFYSSLATGTSITQAVANSMGWVRTFATKTNDPVRVEPPLAAAVQVRAEPEGLPLRASPMDVTVAEERRRRDLQEKIDRKAFDVFLCHNQSDKPSVRRVARALLAKGILPWLDEWELRPGEPWQRVLEAQLDTVSTAAVFVGADGLGPWQRQELDALLRDFVRRECGVIPVVLEGAPSRPRLPRFLEGMMWVDFTRSEPDPMDQLIWGVTGRKAHLDYLAASETERH
ncbi:MAG: toll/interleukin-1 receptor domain-containing protein [Polyangiaceae bacterium]